MACHPDLSPSLVPEAVEEAEEGADLWFRSR